MIRSSIVDPSLPVVVMGLGRFGGGVGVTRWLCDQAGCRNVVVTDLLDSEALSESIAAIRDLCESGQVTPRLGLHDPADFEKASVVVVNPAVPHPWTNRYLNAAREGSARIVTEIEFLLDLLPNRKRVIGVTGSAGKSTTAAMVHHGLTGAGLRSHFGGNIGGSLLRDASTGSIGHDDWVVLELSSAMLYWIGQSHEGEGAGAPLPHIAVVTNVLPNHIDWHGDLEHYKGCKANLFRYQTTEDALILSEQACTALLAGIDPTGLPRRVIVVPPPDEAARRRVRLRIPGVHNVHNGQIASAAVEAAAGIPAAEVYRTLADFPGLPHRLCCVGADNENRRFYDDSKSTTPNATRLAVESFGDEAGRVHLIVGGYDKGLANDSIAELAAGLAGIYTIGVTGPALTDLCRAHAPRADRVFCCGTLDSAFETAVSRMEPGDILLLSPGHASWDQFTNYIERGHRFAALAADWLTSGARS